MENFSSIEKIINDFTTYIQTQHPVASSEMPNIDLYMDQVTTFMEEHLEHCKRFPDDKILTKTMINNYAKNRLLPPPDKKKYSKDHMLFLVFIYYFKNILSISDIQTLLAPLSENFGTDNAGTPKPKVILRSGESAAALREFASSPLTMISSLVCATNFANDLIIFSTLPATPTRWLMPQSRSAPSRPT